MPHKIGVIGTGYVGLVSGTCFAEVGNTVYCVEVDEQKVATMKSGKSPIYEPGLEILLERNLRESRLIFTANHAEAVRNCTMLFLCLPTPPNEDGSADLQYVLQVTHQLATIIKEENITAPRIIITRSTVPVGTFEKVRAVIDEVAPGFEIHVASNPEFLREGFAVEDTMKPERVVIGTRNKFVEEQLRDLYDPFFRNGSRVFVMDERSSEVTKYAANSFLAMKISFMNDLSVYCENVGVDIENVRLGIGSDSRIGKRFIYPGIGYGGSCFPKDVKALIYSAREAGTPLQIIEAVEHVNKEQVVRFVNKLVERFNGNIKGKKFALWGLAFKPNTDDVREAPSYKIIDMLLPFGAEIVAYDPEAKANTEKRYGNQIQYATSMYSCVEGADALIIATEWNEFRNPDFERVANSIKNKVIFDGRNMYDLPVMESYGFEYHSVGRPKVG